MDIYGPDLTQFFVSAGSNPFAVLWSVIAQGGFIIFYPLLCYILCEYFQWSIWLTHLGHREFIFLAIDVPKENEQSLKAVEQIFATLSGPHQNFTFKETYWDGELQTKYSLEIHCKGGYTQFIIMCEKKARDFVESTIYAQYPDAEITEIEDYTKNYPHHFPDKNMEMWGVEMKKTTDDIYPIRTYRMFEHTMTQTFADPMSALLELLSNLHPGEELCMQLVLTPINHKWPDKFKKQIAKVVGAKVKHSKYWHDYLTDAPLKVLELSHDIIFGGVESAKKKDNDGPPNMMLYLTPGEQAILTAMQEKAAKIAYHVKFRFMYVAPKEFKWHRSTITRGMFGAIKQFNTLDMNGFKPDTHTATRAEYMFSDYRKAIKQRHLMHYYKDRDNDAGGQGMILNIEELATIWHFPTIGVSAPGIISAEAKKGTPPRSLPFSNQNTEKEAEVVDEIQLAPKTVELKKAVPPPGLPQIPSVDLHTPEPPANLPIA